MNLLPEINILVFKSIGWTMIHSMWQFLVLFSILKLILFAINKNHSKLRYAVATSILVSAVLCTVLTFIYEYSTYLTNESIVISGGSPIIDSANVGLQVVGADIKVSENPGLLIRGFLNQMSPYLAFGWIFGMILFTIKMINDSLYLRNLRSLPTESNPDITRKLIEMCRRMGITRKIKLILSDAVSEPLTFGWLKPVILFPSSCITQIPLTQLEMIIAHELAHIKRYDFVVNFVQTSIDAVYFFNPFLIAISTAVRNEREFCCDDMAISYTGSYETMAIALANLKCLTRYPKLSLAAAPTKGVFHERIYRLVGPMSRSKFSFKNSFLTLFFTFFLLFVLTKCVSGYKDDLPEINNRLVKVWTDGQANHIIDIYKFEKANKAHEILMVSDLRRKPLYAYINGSKINDQQLIQLRGILKNQDSLIVAKVITDPPSMMQLEMTKIVTLSSEIDSLNQILKDLTSQPNIKLSIVQEQRFNQIKELANSKAEELKEVSMKDYQRQIKNIPSEVGLHKLLTKIVTTREYSESDRTRLNEFLKSRSLNK